MKIQQKSWKSMCSVAAALALGAGASAQYGTRDSGEVVTGRPVMNVSLEDDIRTPQAARRKIVLQRDAEPELQLSVRMRPFAGVDPLALVPTLDEMDTTLVLSGGTAGGMAVLHLDTRFPTLRGVGGVRVVGEFDENGAYELQLSGEESRRGFYAWGEAFFEIRAPGGPAARTTMRPSTDTIDVAVEVRQAYHNWILYWTDLQIRSDLLRNGAEIEAESATLLAVATGSVTPQGARGKIVLEREPRSLGHGGGHTLPGFQPELESGAPAAIEDLPDPQGGQRAFGKIVLERPRTPSQGSGHAQQGGGVELEAQPDPVIEPPQYQDPKGGLRAGNKIVLKRVEQREKNVLRR